MAIERIELTAGMRQNLLSLQKTARSIDKTASRLATGLKVQSALDDAVAYFAAQGHTQRATDLAVRKDEMAEAIQTIKAGNNGIEAINDMISSAKSLAQSALSAATTTEATALMAQYNEVLNQIDTLAADSDYKGINFLTGDTLTVEFAETAGDSSLVVTGFGATSASLGITDATAWTDATAISSGAIQADIALLDAARTTLRTEAKNLSNNLSTITIRQDFTDNMMAVLEEGAANLTLADLDEEGANLLMLQTRQALAQTSLSITSQAAQGVLRLF